ncbi:MAG: hypothetical protein A2015_07855 [Spirochaetes bacterium GWF1_31_7]|nr:MAG: hypothetical protein A2Y30_01945 [Spirochaetes bacterium GWE1_32_154]OHD46955.1 MAG: hypothetical protein A2015_07855 [Spirochaetes bacterium GWF1_31_7]OHD49735.1 MAG: hypothetical protein A2Y29_06055 [Spirochaetes bacterium GWE2_31_10]HBD95537.1 hypothetical protein [Spirochaetia bacterium]HBI36951.1 hypothetical protein [Spirochaetia bacterium]
MPKILIMYPNKMFLEFSKNYLSRFAYEVVTGIDGASLYNTAAKTNPDLILIGRNLPGLELASFLFKKKVSNTLKNIPVYLVGNFSTKEILQLKEYNIDAYISSPINPSALVERINTTFKISNYSTSKSTPMLTDIHVKGKIFVLQIEANLEPDKIDILNFKIRSYCAEKKIKDPRFLFIIPSMYPETINCENLEILFHSRQYPELSVTNRQIKILSKNAHFLETLKKHEQFSSFEIIPDYIYGLERLNVDFDNMQTIPVNYLTAGAKYILDLYDNDGGLRVPARTIITDKMIEYFKSVELRHLIYYSNKDITELMQNTDEDFAVKDEITIADSLLNQTDEMENHTVVNENMDEKMKLFFNKIRDYNCMVITEVKEDGDFIRNSLDDSLKVSVERSGADVLMLLDQKKYILVIVDINVNNPSAYEILSSIRSKASRRKISVIINTKSIDMITVNKFKKLGTDCILVYPYSKQKLLHKVFEFVTQDREN